MSGTQRNEGSDESYQVEAPKDAGAAAAPGRIDQVFARDKFLLKQKVLTINQKYHVSDELGNQILFVQRPAYVFRSILAILGAVFTFLIVAGLMIALGSVLDPKNRNALFAICALGGVLLAVVCAVVVAVLISPKRHVTFFRDEKMTDTLLYVLQDKKYAVTNFSYSVMDNDGNLVAVLRKNYLHDFFRKKWLCDNAQGRTICVIREDSAIKAFLRRFLGGLIAAMLKTDFIITDTSGSLLGRFNRKFTLLDRYVLDMTPDSSHRVDRRVALAIGVMLDTGERR